VTTQVALFDMDRTLVDIHTARLYLRLQRELGEIGLLEALRSSYWLLQYGLGWIKAERVALHDAGVEPDSVEAHAVDAAREIGHRRVVADVDAGLDACSGLPQGIAALAAHADDAIAARDTGLREREADAAVGAGDQDGIHRDVSMVRFVRERVSHSVQT